MYLTDKDKNSARESSDHEEIELMLEHVSTQVEEVVSEAEGLAVSPLSSHVPTSLSCLTSHRLRR